MALVQMQPKPFDS